MPMTLETVIKQMTRQEKFCWTLSLRQTTSKSTLGKYPSRGDDGAIDPDGSIEALRELVEDVSQDGRSRFQIIVKKSPKSNGEEVSTWDFESGENMGGLSGFGGLGNIGQIAQLFQTSKADQTAMMEVISERGLLKYKQEQLDLQKADFEKEKKAWYAEHKELREKWEKLRDATKEGVIDGAPEVLKGVFDAFRGKEAPATKPLAGADSGKEKEADPAPERQTEEARLIEDMASWTFENVTNIYTLRQLNAAVKSPAIREMATFLAREVIDESGKQNEPVLDGIKSSIVKMVTKMKEATT